MRDQRRDAVGIAERKPKSDGSTVIEDVHRKLFQTDLFDEVSNDRGQMIKRVGKGLVIRDVGKPKAGKIRGNDVIIARQLRDQITEHMA